MGPFPDQAGVMRIEWEESMAGGQCCGFHLVPYFPSQERRLIQKARAHFKGPLWVPGSSTCTSGAGYKDGTAGGAGGEQGLPCYPLARWSREGCRAGILSKRR